MLLQNGNQTRQAITAAQANTDVAAAAVSPAGYFKARVWATATSVVAYDEVTSATVGIAVGTTPQDLTFTPAGGDSKFHAQSPTVGAVVHIAFYKD